MAVLALPDVVAFELASPEISERIRVSGHVYDVGTGLLSTVVPGTGRTQDPVVVA